MFRCQYKFKIMQVKCFLRGSGLFVLSVSFHMSIKCMSSLSFELPVLYPSWEATSEGSWVSSEGQETKVHTYCCRGLDQRVCPCPSAGRVTAEMCRQGSNGEEHPPRSPSWSRGAVLAQAGMWAVGQSSCLGEAGGDGFNNLFQAGRSKLLRAFPAQLWESLFPY